MSDTTLPYLAFNNFDSRRAVKWMVTTWFSIAAVGHGLFLIYIFAVFYPPIAEYGFRGLEGMHLPTGFREGDTLGNLSAIAHVLLAAVVIGGGPLQLVPAVRQRLPKFHRVLGRSYLLAAVVCSVGGIYMTWTRESVGDSLSHISITLDGILILVFAWLTVRTAMARNIVHHRRWALRLFMAASAVWFFRVALMGWATITGGWGIEWKSFTGPFISLLGFAQYVLPLLMLEWYFYCQTPQSSTTTKWAFVGILMPLTVFMTIGIFAATMGMWLPRMG